MQNVLLYIVTVAVWGTSWLAIKYQLGVVAPEVSVAYRFLLSACLMLGFCWISRRSLRFSLADHARMAFQGSMLFGTNYYLLYLASQYLTTGLVAVLFSTVLLMTMFGSVVLFKTRITARLALGALLGISGISLVFWQDLVKFDLASDTSLGLVLALFGTLAAGVGMLSSALYQKRGLPVIETTSIAMAYGAAFMVAVSLFSGKPFTIDFSLPYVGGLLFLSVFASVIGFSCYLTLLGRIGAERASYASVLFPVIALTLSMIFENFQWTVLALVGTGLILTGNLFVLLKPKS